MKKKPNPEMIDDDNPEWTEDTFRRARPARDVLPEIFSAALAAEMLKPKGRGLGKKTAKAVTTLRLPVETLIRWKATGPGWQTRMAKVLENAIM